MSSIDNSLSSSNSSTSNVSSRLTPAGAKAKASFETEIAARPPPPYSAANRWGQPVPKHGHYNTDPVAAHRAFSQGLLQKYLNLFPVRMQIPVGIVSIFAVSYGIYEIIKPSPNNRPLKTLTPEWKEANRAYSEAQNLNPIRRYKEHTEKSQ